MTDSGLKQKLPIGIQNFEDIRRNDYLYIDKTAYIYELIQNGKPYFLSRPRRFGKSLLVSTMKAYFEGRSELFDDLDIYELSKDDPDAFVPHPVFYFDFNGADYSAIKDMSDEDESRISSVMYGVDVDSIGDESDDINDIINHIQFKTREGSRIPVLPVEQIIDEHLRNWEDVYGSDPRNKTLPSRFRYLIRTAVERTGRKAVVLVDEYDKALLEENPVIDDLNRLAYKAFFGVLKSYDEYLKFIFITGVTKYTKVSIFSDLNQLEDISLDDAYAGICGITEQEIRDNLSSEVEDLASRRNFTADECYRRLRDMYDGYHFSEECEGVYNPFSLLNCLKKKKFGSYWFETGTPTFLIRKLTETGFDVKRITEQEIYANEKKLSDYRNDSNDPVPLLYQTGYLTIIDYDEEFDSYLLDYPNDEVRYGFLESLVPMILNDSDSKTTALDIRSFGQDIKKGDTDGFKKRLTALYASLPYYEGKQNSSDDYLERDFQNVIYITFMLLGQFIRTQVHNSVGRADAIVETADFVWIFEFKRDKTAEEALAQIDEKGYALPFAADSRTLIKIGVNFSSHTRNIDGWVVV